MPFSAELVIAPVEAVVSLEVAHPVDHHHHHHRHRRHHHLEVAHPVDQVEHREAQREQSSGNLVNSEK